MLHVNETTFDCDKSVNDICSDITMVNKLLADAKVSGFVDAKRTQPPPKDPSLHSSNDSFADNTETTTTTTSSSAKSAIGDAKVLLKTLKDKLQSLRLTFADFTCNARQLVNYKYTVSHVNQSIAQPSSADIQSREVELSNTIKRLVYAGNFLVTCIKHKKERKTE